MEVIEPSNAVATSVSVEHSVFRRNLRPDTYAAEAIFPIRETYLVARSVGSRLADRRAGRLLGERADQALPERAK